MYENLTWKSTSNLVENSPWEPHINRLQNMIVGGLVGSSVCWRSTANDQIFDRWANRSTSRSTGNWAITQQSTTWSTGPFPKSRHSLAVDRGVYWPLAIHVCACRSTVQSTDLRHYRPWGRPAEGQKNSFGDLKTWLLTLIKSHKFSENLQK